MMGMSIGFSSVSTSISIGNKDNYSTIKKSKMDLNPKADNFILKNIRRIGDCLVVLVKYPNCTTYNGNKVLVYKGITRKEIKRWKLLDPHFLENKNFISPIARFPANKLGIKRARILAFALKKEIKCLK